MRVVLTELSQSKIPMLKIGILSLASFIKKHGHTPILLDLSLSLKTGLNQKSFIEEASKRILGQKPGIIGFSTMCDSLPSAILVAKQCKKTAPHIPIIFGGVDVSFEDKKIIELFKDIDIIVRGEGEITLLEILSSTEEKRPLKNILGITYRNKNNIIANPDRPLIKNLDTLPLPDFSLVSNLKKYKRIQIEAGRGCPYQCTYCSTCKMWRRHFRIKSPERLLREMRLAYKVFKKNKILELHLIHDNILTNRKWAERFLSLAGKQNFSWTCDARLNSLDKRLLEKLKKAGCTSIFIGLESGSAKIQKRIKKGLDLDSFPKIAEAAQKNSIFLSLSLMLGLPAETEKDINKTLMLALKSKFHTPLSTIQLNLFSLLKGTDLYKQARKKSSMLKFSRLGLPPTLTGSHAEKHLIKKHPELFSYYFYYKNSRLDPKFLQKTGIIFTFLCEFFPATTLLIMQNYSLPPFCLSQKIVPFFDAKNISWRIPLKDQVTFKHYLPIYKEFLFHCFGSFPSDIKEMLIHEETFQKAFFAKKTIKKKEDKFNYSSIPRLCNGVYIKAYTYNLHKTIKSLSGYNRTINKEPIYLLYKQENIFFPFPLSRNCYKLLSRCNGKRSINRIVNEFKDSMTKANKNSLLRVFQSFHKNGIIKAVPETDKNK
ncbi:MAG: radical SAM protein [Candidatus Saganbacteria bacterium]|nr:radical SAM protein [Candidatus Saganbacteria bacterium]